MHNQFDFAIAFANVVVQHIKEKASPVYKGLVHIGHDLLTDDFIQTELCSKMIENIILRLSEKGIDVHITISKVKQNQHQLDIDIK